MHSEIVAVYNPIFIMLGLMHISIGEPMQLFKPGASLPQAGVHLVS